VCVGVGVVVGVCVSKGTSGTLKSTTLVSKVKYTEGTYGGARCV